MTLLQQLTCPQAFPIDPPEASSIMLIQTHASAVVLTPQRETGWALFSSDAIRKRLALFDPT